jgi:uncharacterized protein (TIGR01777 family)
MKIFITGGTGFIGRQLTARLVKFGHRVTVLSRSAKSPSLRDIEKIVSDPCSHGEWQRTMKTHDAVINLAGSSVFCRWSKRNRQKIIGSRVMSTRNIATALNEPDSQVRTLINASAIGYYGDTGEIEVTEKAPSGSDFLAEVTRKWEAEATRCSSARVACCRFGVVLGKSAGPLARMLPAFRAGLGSPLGSGNQWLPWIHIDDLTEAICFILDHENLAGPINLTAPEPVTNRQFSISLARTLKRPFFMPPLPSFMLRLLLGETASLLLNSNKIKPAILEKSGFIFKFGGIDSALTDLVGEK